MVAILLSAVLGFVWMGEGGAIAFALAGLWGCHGAARPWSLGPSGLALVLAAATLVPALLWASGALRPDFATHLALTLAPFLERVLDFTHADALAHQTLSDSGLVDRMPAIRLGVGTCWLCALPAAAAILLWYRERPSSARPADGVVALGAGAAGLATSTVLLVSGAGFGAGAQSLSLGYGAVLYPLTELVWLASIASLRTWANGRFAADAPLRAPIP